MSYSRPCFFLIASFFSLIISNTSFAQETTTVTTVKKEITTPTPTGSCTTVNGHWEDNIWVATQTVCKYENRSEGVAWIEGYWACSAYTDADCTTWEFKPGHWVKTLP